MSDNVMSVGIMVPLTKKVDHEDVNDALYNIDSVVHINYEGTLAYTDYRGEDPYGIKFYTPMMGDLSDFVVLKRFSTDIVAEKAKGYSCYWYNGVDSDMSIITLEEFLANTQ